MPRTCRALVCAGASFAIIGLLLAGCTSPESEPVPTGTASTSPAPSPVSTPTLEPVFDGTADENQPYFDQLNRELIASGGTLNGGAFIDNLVAHGYARANMEVTPDTTSIGVAADNIVFSIRFGTTCLLGQWGNIGYTSLVTEVLSTGRCLVGTAHPA
ncbi:MAG: hypothetical protein QM675_12465 [Protaetiibacter sp.]